MKSLSLLCALTLLSAVAVSGCSDGFQLVDANTADIGERKAAEPKDTNTNEEEVIVPVNVSGGTTETPEEGANEEQDLPPAPICTPETDAEFCGRLSKDCEAVTAADNCGTPRTVDCGTCESGFICGGETPNVCSSVTAPYCYTYGFVSTRDGYENMYTSSTCSKDEPKQVTHNTNEETRFRNLQISTDGKKVSYDYFYLGAADWTMSIEDIATFGRGGLNISGCRSAALSPTNDRVVYVCSTGLYFNDQRDSALTRLIASDYQDSRIFEKAVWSPVSTETDASHDKVVFSVKEADGSDRFYVYNAKTGLKTRPLYEQYSGDGHDVVLKGSSADISPDGKTMVFVRKSAVDNQDQIWACDLMFDQVFAATNSFSSAASRFPTEAKESLCVNPRILTDEGNNVSPHWTPNGKHVFFNSDRDGNKEIYVMKADGTEETNLTHDPASDRDSDVFPIRRGFDDSFGADKVLIDKAGF